MRVGNGPVNHIWCALRQTPTSPAGESSLAGVDPPASRTVSLVHGQGGGSKTTGVLGRKRADFMRKDAAKSMEMGGECVAGRHWTRLIFGFAAGRAGSPSVPGSE